MSNILDSNLPDSNLSRALDVDVALEFQGCQDSEIAELAGAVRRAVRCAAAERGCTAGQIGVLITDDAAIRKVNQTHLDHDFATDVISFAYAAEADVVEGEMIVSGQTAQRQASRIGSTADNRWTWQCECLLYVVHGMLHITGMDDATAPQRAAMRDAERRVLQRLGIESADEFHADRFAALDDVTQREPKS